MRGDEKGEMGGWFGINSDAKPAMSRKFGYAAGEGVQCPEVHHAMVVAVVGRSGNCFIVDTRAYYFRCSRDARTGARIFTAAGTSTKLDLET